MRKNTKRFQNQTAKFTKIIVILYSQEKFRKKRINVIHFFHVVDAGYSKFDVNSDLKITFYVISPQKKTVLQENKKDMAILKYKVTSPGDYKVCLDNGFSQSYEKTVYFEISIDTETNWDTINEMLEEDTKSNDTISRLKRTAQKVRTNFENIKHYQDTLRAVEARDINIQEKNLTKVNSYSSLTTVAMILFGALHLLLLKSLFNPSSLLFKILKILC
ncbi:transmembrane emp24 domain-containing protein 1-like isoform X2 [Parasteatoda tepidariorum]|uniref:transmembrane emp24 domain-containing protein 1-like isoform X2 n=1 Tax=Parasteatoda tepidariorum TaxID=114398 RepID=UPI0039BD78F9